MLPYPQALHFRHREMIQMQRMFGAICRDLSFRPVSRPYPFEDIKKSLTDCKCRVYSDNKRFNLCDGRAGLCSAAAKEASLEIGR